MIVTIYASNTSPNPSLGLILQFFNLYGDKTNIIHDTKQMMLISKGNVNPTDGFVVLIQGKLCYDIFDVCREYEIAGLRPC